jgi:hypothetical protein
MVPASAPGGTEVDAFALFTEEAEHFDAAVSGGAEPVRNPSVELGSLTGSHGEIVVAQFYAELSAKHIEPFISRVSPQVGLFIVPGDGHLVCAWFSLLPRQRDEHPAVFPGGALRHARVEYPGCGDDFVEGDAARCGDRQEELEAWLALS